MSRYDSSAGGDQLTRSFSQAHRPQHCGLGQDVTSHCTVIVQSASLQILNVHWMARTAGNTLTICLWWFQCLRRPASAGMAGASPAVFVQHVINLKLNEYITRRAAPGTDLTARLNHAAAGRAADTHQLEKNHLRRARSKRRMRALQLCLFHWWKPPQGCERPGIT